jgi:hypothetical protein
MTFEVGAERGMAACWDEVGTPMHRCTVAHLESGNELSATTNRSKCMWIIGQP